MRKSGYLASHNALFNSGLEDEDMINNNATLANEICKLCVKDVPLKEYLASISVYSAGGPPAPTGLIPFDNPYLIGAFCLIAVLIGVILVCCVHLNTLKKKDEL